MDVRAVPRRSSYLSVFALEDRVLLRAEPLTSPSDFFLPRFNDTAQVVAMVRQPIEVSFPATGDLTSAAVESVMTAALSDSVEGVTVSVDGLSLSSSACYPICGVVASVVLLVRVTSEHVCALSFFYDQLRLRDSEYQPFPLPAAARASSLFSASAISVNGTLITSDHLAAATAGLASALSAFGVSAEQITVVLVRAAEMEPTWNGDFQTLEALFRLPRALLGAFVRCRELGAVLALHAEEDPSVIRRVCLPRPAAGISLPAVLISRRWWLRISTSPCQSEEWRQL